MLYESMNFRSTYSAQKNRRGNYLEEIDVLIFQNLYPYLGPNSNVRWPERRDRTTVMILNFGFAHLRSSRWQKVHFICCRKRSSVIVRTQLSVRVHSCIGKPYFWSKISCIFNCRIGNSTTGWNLMNCISW